MNRQHLKEKEIKSKLTLAKVYLHSAKNSFKAGDCRLATDAAYNALELTMKAAILSKTESIPRRHGGIAQLFSLLFIKKGPLPTSYGRKIGEALELRNKARYDTEAKINQQHALTNLKLAEELSDSLTKIIKVKD